MFVFLGRLVARFWPLVLIAWLLFFGLGWRFAPAWDEVATEGDSHFLPEDSPSRRGERLFKTAFPDDYSGSSILLRHLPRKRQDRITGRGQEVYCSGPLARTKENCHRGGQPVRDRRVSEPKQNGARTSKSHRADPDPTRSGGGCIACQPGQARCTYPGRAHNAIPRPPQLVRPWRKSKVWLLASDRRKRFRRGSKLQSREVRRRDATWGEPSRKCSGCRDLDNRRGNRAAAAHLSCALITVIPLATVYFAVQVSLALLSLLAETQILDLSKDLRIFITVIAMVPVLTIACS